MKSKSALVLCSLAFAIAVIFPGPSAQAQKAPRRIVFARGATIARATGYLRGVRDESWFVIRAGTGQNMRVEIRGRGPTRGVLFFPSGKQDGGPGGIIFNGMIDETGDYRIRVTESSMANAWRGRFTLTVEILPGGQTNPDSAGLESYVGKYPSELFRKVPALKSRLRSLLGGNYRAFLDQMQVETPFERDGGVMFTRGCMAHQCTIEEALLAIDLGDGKLYVALKFGDRFQTFPKDRTRLPDALKRAMEDQP